MFRRFLGRRQIGVDTQLSSSCCAVRRFLSDIIIERLLRVYIYIELKERKKRNKESGNTTKIKINNARTQKDHFRNDYVSFRIVFETRRWNRFRVVCNNNTLYTFKSGILNLKRFDWKVDSSRGTKTRRWIL